MRSGRSVGFVSSPELGASVAGSYRALGGTRGKRLTWGMSIPEMGGSVDGLGWGSGASGSKRLAGGNSLPEVRGSVVGLSGSSWASGSKRLAGGMSLPEMGLLVVRSLGGCRSVTSPQGGLVEHGLGWASGGMTSPQGGLVELGHIGLTPLSSVTDNDEGSSEGNNGFHYSFLFLVFDSFFNYMNT